MLNSWERLANPAGGSVAGLATVATEGGAVVFGATVAGVYRSSDAGRTWVLPTLGRIVPFAEAVAVSVDFGRDRTVFACAPDALYRSVDGADDWQRVLVGSRMLSVATSAGNQAQGLAEGHGLAEEHGLVLAGTETDGVLRSEDGGRTWTGANAGLLDLTALTLALSPAFERDRLGFVGTPSGVYRTRNGTRSWRALDFGLDEPAVQCLALSPTFADDHLVLAGTEAHGLLRSDDAGTTWHAVPAVASGGVTAVAFATRWPAHKTIAAATESGVAVSPDGGLTWRATSPPPGVVLCLGFVTDGANEALLAGLHRQGFCRSEDGGASWQPANDGLSAGLPSGLALSPDFARDGTLFAGSLQDGVSVSVDRGQTWAPSNEGLAEPTVLGLTVSPAYAQDRTLYAATPAGTHVSRDAAATWQPMAPSEPARLIVAGTQPAVIAALGGGRLLAMDHGATAWQTFERVFEHSEISALALSPDFDRDRTFFVGTTQPTAEGAAELVLWRSVDNGQRWSRWLVARGADPLVMAIPATFPIDEVLFVAVGGRVLRPLRHAREKRAGERRPVWRGTDVGGETVVVTGLATSPNYRADGTVFAATSAGMFVSHDCGDSFQSWSEGLAAPRLVGLAISPSYADDGLVYALGLGGSIWRRRAG